MFAGILHHDRRRALVLAGERRTGPIKFYAIALDRAARRDVHVERRLAHRIGLETAVFLLGDGQHVVEQDPGLVEAHRTVRRNIGGAGFLPVARDHGLDEIADSGCEFRGIEQLRGHRIDIAEIVDVRAESRAQLVELAIARAGAKQHLEAKAVLACLAQEQGDVGIVSGVRDHVGFGALELGYQHREVGRGRRIAFLEHDLEAGLLGIGLVGGGNADAVGTVFVNQRDLDVLGLDAELGFGVFADEVRKGLAVLIGMNLRPENVLQVFVLEHGGRNRGRDPEDFLVLLDFARERDRVRTRINAVDDVDLLLVDQAFGFIDRNVGLALGIGGERGDLVLATDAALLVDEIDCNLRADRRGNRPARSKGTGQVVDQADAQRLGLCPCACPIEAQHGGRSRGILEQRSA